jgi:hypothetical protein
MVDTNIFLFRLRGKSATEIGARRILERRREAQSGITIIRSTEVAP